MRNIENSLRVLPRKIFKQGGVSERSEVENYKGKYRAREAGPYKGVWGESPQQIFEF